MTVSVRLSTLQDTLIALNPIRVIYFLRLVNSFLRERELWDLIGGSQTTRMDATSVFSDEDTGIFEPIAGLANTDYMVSQATGTDNEQSLVSLAHAIGVAEKAHGFYVDLAAALRSRRRGLSKRFENMARKNSNGKQKLISLQGPEVGKGVK